MSDEGSNQADADRTQMIASNWSEFVNITRRHFFNGRTQLLRYDAE